MYSPEEEQSDQHPLHDAVIEGKIDTIRQLLAECTDKEAQTALVSDALYGAYDALTLAVMHKNDDTKEIITELLPHCSQDMIDDALATARNFDCPEDVIALLANAVIEDTEEDDEEQEEESSETEDTYDSSTLVATSATTENEEEEESSQEEDAHDNGYSKALVVKPSSNEGFWLNFIINPRLIQKIFTCNIPSTKASITYFEKGPIRVTFMISHDTPFIWDSMLNPAVVTKLLSIVPYIDYRFYMMKDGNGNPFIKSFATKCLMKLLITTTELENKAIKSLCASPPVFAFNDLAKWIVDISSACTTQHQLPFNTPFQLTSPSGNFLCKAVTGMISDKSQSELMSFITWAAKMLKIRKTTYKEFVVLSNTATMHWNNYLGTVYELSKRQIHKKSPSIDLMIQDCLGLLNSPPEYAYCPALLPSTENGNSIQMQNPHHILISKLCKAVLQTVLNEIVQKNYDVPAALGHLREGVPPGIAQAVIAAFDDVLPEPNDLIHHDDHKTSSEIGDSSSAPSSSSSSANSGGNTDSELSQCELESSRATQNTIKSVSTSTNFNPIESTLADLEEQLEIFQSTSDLAPQHKQEEIKRLEKEIEYLRNRLEECGCESKKAELCTEPEKQRIEEDLDHLYHNAATNKLLDTFPLPKLDENVAAHTPGCGPAGDGSLPAVVHNVLPFLVFSPSYNGKEKPCKQSPTLIFSHHESMLDAKCIGCLGKIDDSTSTTERITT